VVGGRRDDGAYRVRVVHPAGRVRGRGQHDGGCVRPHPVGQAVGVQRVAVGGRQRHLNRPAVREDRLRRVVRPGRPGVQQLLARADDGERREVQRLHAADRNDDLVDAVLDPVLVGHRVADRPPGLG
jgi:hypothetical protein